MRKITSLVVVMVLFLSSVPVFANEPVIDMKKIFENTQKKHNKEINSLFNPDSAYEAEMNINIGDRRNRFKINFDLGMFLDKDNKEWGASAELDINEQPSVSLGLELFVDTDNVIIGGISDVYFAIPINIEDENHNLYPLSQALQGLSFDEIKEISKKSELVALAESYQNYLNNLALKGQPISWEEGNIESPYGNIPVTSYTYSAQKEYGKNYIKNIFKMLNESVLSEFIGVLPVFSNMGYAPWDQLNITDDFTYTLYVNEEDIIVRYMSEAELIINDKPYTLIWYWDIKDMENSVTESEMQFTIAYDEEVEGINLTVTSQTDSADGNIKMNITSDYIVNEETKRGLEVLATYNPEKSKDNFYMDFLCNIVEFDSDYISYPSTVLNDDYEYDYDDYYYDDYSYTFTVDDFLEIFPHGTQELYESYIKAAEEYEAHYFYSYDLPSLYYDYGNYFFKLTEEELLNIKKQNKIYQLEEVNGKDLAYDEYTKLMPNASPEDYKLYQEFVRHMEFYSLKYDVLVSPEEYLEYFPEKTTEDYNEYRIAKQWNLYESGGYERIQSDYSVVENAFTYEEHLNYFPGSPVEFYEDMQMYFKQDKFSMDGYSQLFTWDEYKQCFPDASEEEYSKYAEEFYEMEFHFYGFERLFSYEEFLKAFPDADLEEYESYKEEYEYYQDYLSNYDYNDSDYDYYDDYADYDYYSDYEDMYGKLLSYEEYKELNPYDAEHLYDYYIENFYYEKFYAEDFSRLYSLEEYLTFYPDDTTADYDYFVREFKYRNFIQNRWSELLSEEEYKEIYPDDDYSNYLESYINHNDTEVSREVFNKLYPDATLEEYEFYANNRDINALRIQAVGSLAVSEDSYILDVSKVLNNIDQGMLLDFSLRITPKSTQTAFLDSDKPIVYIAELSEDELDNLILRWKSQLLLAIYRYMNI